jgi:YidC/Oxa1 family membrane protein insertase
MILFQNPLSIRSKNIIMDNQRNILLIALAVVGFLIWQQWQMDYGPKPPQTQSTAVSTAESGTSQNPANAQDLPQAVPSDSPGSAAVQSGSQPSVSSRISVKTDVLNLVIDTRGGDIIYADLPTYPVSLDEPENAFRLFNDNPETLYIAQSGLIHTKQAGQDLSGRAPSHYAIFKSELNEFRLQEGQDELRVPLTWVSPDGVAVTKTYIFRRGEFLVDVEHQVSNQSQQAWAGRQYRQLRRTYVDTSLGSNLIYTYTGPAYYDGKYEKIGFDDMHEETLGKEIEHGWIAMLQHYFLSAWVAGEGSSDWYYTNIIPRDGITPTHYIIGMRSAEKVVNPGDQGVFSSQVFIGPKLQATLEEISPGLELTTDYGMFTIFSKPLFWLLSIIHDWIGNWGWAIIIVTILIKLAFYRLSATSYRSMAKMRAVQPKMQKLKETYGEDKQRMNQALMDLYKKEKINPLGGCLPILVQIPVFIAFYWMLLESVEMRQAPFMFWIQDLSTKDPYFVLPVIMGASMLIQQKLNPAPLDPLQQKIMMAMPIVFTVFFAFFPSGLVLYWVTNNILSIAQQWWIMKKMEQGAKA